MSCAPPTRRATPPPTRSRPKAPHFPAKAKRVIFLFMTGGVSHVDSFDPKPKLFADHGKTVTVDNWQGKPGKFNATSKSRSGTFKPRGKMRHRGQRPVPAHRRVRRRHVRDPLDEVGPHQPLRSDAGDAHRVVHVRPAEHRRLGELRPGHGEPQPAVVRGAGAGRALRRRPDLGRRLPARLPPGHARRARPDADRRPRRAARLAPTCRTCELDLLAAVQPGPPGPPAGDAALAARIRSFETAFGMQREAPEAFDLSRETDATLQLYGLERGGSTGFALAMPGRPPAGRARRALHRADRRRLVEQLGLARRHDWPTSRWPRTSTSPSPACSPT